MFQWRCLLGRLTDLELRIEIRLQTSMLEAPVSLPLVNEIAQRESEDGLARTEKYRVLGIPAVQGYAKEEKPIHKGNWGLPNSSGIRDATESLRKRVQQWKYYRNMDYEKEWMHHRFPTTADPRTMWGLGADPRTAENPHITLTPPKVNY